MNFISFLKLFCPVLRCLEKPAQDVKKSLARNIAIVLIVVMTGKLRKIWMSMDF